MRTIVERPTLQSGQNGEQEQDGQQSADDAHDNPRAVRVDQIGKCDFVVFPQEQVDGQDAEGHIQSGDLTSGGPTQTPRQQRSEENRLPGKDKEEHEAASDGAG